MFKYVCFKAAKIQLYSIRTTFQRNFLAENRDFVPSAHSHRHGHSQISQHPLFRKTVKIVDANDDMVQKLDAHDFARRFYLVGYLDVLPAGFQRVGRVVVPNDDSRGVVEQCFLEDASNVHDDL